MILTRLACRAYTRGLGRPLLIAVAALGYSLVAHGEDAASAAAPDPNTLITTYAEYWKDGVRQEVRPIRMEIVVTLYDPSWNLFWGENDGQPGYIPCDSLFPMKFADRVLIEGTVIPREGLDAATITVTVLEHDVPIPPLDTRGRIGEFDRFRERIVVCDALLDTQANRESNHLVLELIAEGHRVHALCWVKNAQKLDLPEGTILRVTGLYSPIHDPRTETTEINLWLSGLEAIVPIGNLATDRRFDRPLKPISQLAKEQVDRKSSARIAGFVRAYVPGESITLRDESGQIIVRTMQTLPLQIGDMIEAEGDPYTWAADWLLRSAVVRRPSAEALARLQAPPAATPTLSIVGQILELTPEDAARERPVEIFGVVVWCSPVANTMIVRDASGGILVHLQDISVAPPNIGVGVRVFGVTVAGGYAPEVKAAKVDVWGSAILPEAQVITLEQAMTGQLQGHRVDLRGHVQSVQTDDRWTRLTLGTNTGEFTVRLDRFDDAASLVGSIVSARGICQVQADARRQLASIELWSNSPDEIRVEQVAPADPFSVALRPVRSLRQFNPDASTHRWARVRGVVTHFLPGRRLYVQDDDEGILILSRQTAPLAPGDVVEATGLPGLQNQRVVLRDAVYRKIEHAGEPEPVMVEQPRALADNLESQLVRLRGRLVNSVLDTDTVTLAIQAPDIVFNAVLPRATSAIDGADLQPGSELELTGVYEVVRNERNQPSGLRLQLRTPADVIVRARPSWWTPARLLVAMGALAACIAIAGTWAEALRRRVQRQTTQIRAQLVKEANLEAHNRDIVANASDAIFTTDLTGRFSSFNPAGERMTGFTCEQALRMSLRDLVVREDAADLAARLDTLHNGDATVTFQSRFRRRDDTTVWVETSLRLRRDGDQAIGVLGVVRDVSERKQIEDELKRARNAAEANTQAKSAFLANMSHEIRTPMNAVIGMSNLLLDTSLDEEQREFACTIRNGAESLLTVLNDILDFSRMEAGKLNFETIDFDLAETINHTIAMLVPRAKAKGLALQTSLPPDLPAHVRGDSGRLRQVLLNLVGNAVKFTPEGEVKLVVSVIQSDPVSATLRFAVTDTGIGMPTAIIERLFQPFSQADNSMARRFGGTGLGLAISKQIVELMGGAIGAESEPDVGSTFWFDVPFAHAAAPDAPATTPAPESEPLPSLRVLVAEDNLTNQRLVSLQLGKLGCTVAIANHGLEVLEALERAEYDLVFMDCQMPEMDGFETTRRIRRSARFGRIRIVAMTANAMAGDRQHCLDVGMDEYLSKPVRPADLRAALARAAQTSIAATS